MRQAWQTTTTPDWRPVPRNVQQWYIQNGKRLACTRTMPDGSWEINMMEMGKAKAVTMARIDALPAWQRDLIHEHGSKGRRMPKPRKARVDLTDLGL